MNKKGFAVSVILYSIIFLIVTTLFMLLGIMRTRFNVNDKLRENIREKINGEVNIGSVFISNEECQISANTSEYTDNLILTINVNDNACLYNGHDRCQYSWDNVSFSGNNTITVNKSMTYTGYFKDKAGGKGSCKREITSKTQYRYRDCRSIQYGEWYEDGNESYVSSCPENIQSKEDAISSNANSYAICESSTSSLCGSLSPCYRLKSYKRNPTGCNSWDAWIDSDSFMASSAIRDSRSVTLYKVK